MGNGATIRGAVKEGVLRRKFIKYLLGAMSALFASSAIAATLRYLLPLQRASEIEKAVEIARVGEIPIGGFKERWSFLGFPAILMHHPGGYKSFAAKCTHLGCTASWREGGWPAIGKGEAVLFCPCHDGVFDHETGEVLAGPPPSPLPEILVEERGGMVVATAWKDPEYVNSLPMYRK